MRRHGSLPCRGRLQPFPPCLHIRETGRVTERTGQSALPPQRARLGIFPRVLVLTGPAYPASSHEKSVGAWRWHEPWRGMAGEGQVGEREWEYRRRRLEETVLYEAVRVEEPGRMLVHLVEGLRARTRVVFAPFSIRPPGPTQTDFSRFRSIGSERIRLPVAAKIALHRAGRIGGNAGSPNPVGGFALWTKCTSIGGA